ncbi:hypothetical protein [Halomicrococcus sp. NG-SE-24]|uniref:hypothetical protein n=1 Tax=Halomicrococcus sp. NG-SE-24 TaxID=3436928 RepID=UPI003D982E95
MTGAPPVVALHGVAPLPDVPHWAALFAAVFCCWTVVAVGVWCADALLDRLGW